MSTIQINHPQLSVQVAPGADTGRARLTFSVDISKSSLNNLIRLLDAALPPGQELIIDLGKFSHSKKSFRPPRPENMEQVLREKSQYPSSPRPASDVVTKEIKTPAPPVTTRKSSNVNQPKGILKKGSSANAGVRDKNAKNAKNAKNNKDVKNVRFNLPANKPKIPPPFQGMKSELKRLPVDLIIPDPILNLMDKETLGYAREWEPGLPFLVPKDINVDEKTAKEAVEYMTKRAESRTGRTATSPYTIDSRYGDSLDHSRARNRSQRRSKSTRQTQIPQQRAYTPVANSRAPIPLQTRAPSTPHVANNDLHDLNYLNDLSNLNDDTINHARVFSQKRSSSTRQAQTPQHNTTVFAANSHRGTPSGTRPAGGIKQAPPSTVKGASDQSPAPDRANGKPSNSGPLKTAQNFFKSIVNFLLPNFRA